MNDPVSLHTTQHLMVSLFLIFAILGVVISHYGFNFTSLIVNATELFMCLLAISLSSSMKDLCFFAHFLVGLFVYLLLSFEGTLYMQNSSHLSDIWFAYTLFTVEF